MQNFIRIGTPSHVASEAHYVFHSYSYTCLYYFFDATSAFLNMKILVKLPKALSLMFQESC